MKYKRLDICPTTNLNYCFAGTIMHECTLRLSRGKAIGDTYPEDPYSVQVPLEEGFEGLDLPDIVGNTQGLLILSEKAIQTIIDSKLQIGPFDVCPFTLMNHDGKEHSRNFAFLNPIETYDIAHEDTNYKRYKRSQKIYGCWKWVLDSNKLLGMPDLLREQEVLDHYFVSENFIEVVKSEGLANFEFIEVEQK